MVQNPRNRYQYEKARFLRNRGLSYNEIKRELGISKSNISLWCRDISLSDRQKTRLRKNHAISTRIGARANHEKRQKEILAVKESAKKEVGELNIGAFKVAGMMLYWAEGAKTSSTSLSNSDPKIIDLMVRWFRVFLDIYPKRLQAYLHIHYGNDETKIKKYWSQLTGIPLKNFGKSFIKPKGTGRRTNILPNGIIKIRVTGAGTEDLRHRILAWSEKIHEISRQYR